MDMVDRRAPVQEDGIEPLVISHPHHAVHPHHPGGPSLLRASQSTEEDRPARPMGIRMHSSSFSDDNPPAVHLHCKSRSTKDAGPACLSTHGPAAAEGAGLHLSSYGGNNNVVTRPLCCRPNFWKEAYHSNMKEFWDHWRDFFVDIYFNNDCQDKNDNNGSWDIFALSIELPFTIVRKLTNPVPCDGYYCLPLVVVTLALSPIWLWSYFLDQFGVNIFLSYIGHVLSTMTLMTRLFVIRFAPGGKGPMDCYMVLPWCH
jgi:hypothetical protein